MTFYRLIILGLFLFPTQELWAAENGDSEVSVQVPAAKISSASKLMFGFGLPDLLSISYAKEVRSGWWGGVDFGLIPLGTFINVLSIGGTNAYSSGYTIDVEPRAYALSSGLFVEYHPWGGEGHFKLMGNIFIGSVQATALLKNVDSGTSAPAATMDFTIIEPVISLRYGNYIYKAETWSIGWEAGVSFYFPITLKAAATGSLPAYLQAAPQYQSSIQYGMADAQGEMTDLVNSLNVKPAFLPSFLIHATF